MPPSRSRVRESTSSIEEEIRTKIRAQGELTVKTREFAEEVLAHARSISPVETGAYAAAWHIENRPPLNGWPRFAVINRHWTAHFIEFGTGKDTKPGSPFGPDTPTPEFAVAAKTAAFFGGTP